MTIPQRTKDWAFEQETALAAKLEKYFPGHVNHIALRNPFEPVDIVVTYPNSQLAFCYCDSKSSHAHRDSGNFTYSQSTWARAKCLLYSVPVLLASAFAGKCSWLTDHCEELETPYTWRQTRDPTNPYKLLPYKYDLTAVLEQQRERWSAKKDWFNG